MRMAQPASASTAHALRNPDGESTNDEMTGTSDKCMAQQSPPASTICARCPSFLLFPPRPQGPRSPLRWCVCVCVSLTCAVLGAYCEFEQFLR